MVDYELRSAKLRAAALGNTFSKPEPAPKPERPKRQPKPKPDYFKIWMKVSGVVGDCFPDGDPIDELIPYMERTGITMKEINRAVKEHSGSKSYNSYLRDLWKDTAADQVHDARNGHVDPHSPFYTVEANGRIKPTPNPWSTR